MIFVNVIGLIGVSFVLAMYFMLQINKIRADGLTYSLLNAIGSILILISLCFYFNLSSAAIESAWLAISLFGVYQAWQRRRSRAQ